MGKKRRPAKSRVFSKTAPNPVVNIAEKRSVREALQANRKPSIFVATLTEDGWINYTIGIAFGCAMASTMTPECPFRFGIHVEPGKRGPDFARNSIVKAFMENTDSDWLVMIDADQVVPENFWQLCTVRDADIVSGITPVWVGNMDPEAMYRVNNYGVDDQGRCYNLPMPDDGVKQPYRVPVVGTGCIAIRRRVFAPPPHGLGTNCFMFTHEDNRKVKAGEDVNFSVAANRAGFTIAVHPQVRFDHIKELPLFQLEQWYQARKKAEMDGRKITDEQRLSIG